MNVRDEIRDLQPRNAVEGALATSTFVNTFGNGLFSVTSALFFTRIVGISPLQLGFAFSLAAGVGLAFTMPMGQLADYVSPRRLNVWLSGFSSIGMFLWAFADSYRWFLVVAVMLAVSDQGGRAARGVLISRAGGADGKVRIRAYLRAITNLGIAIGSLVGGAALAVDQEWFYRALIMVNAVSTLLSSQVLRRLPEMAVTRPEQKPRRTEALRDHTYVALTIANVFIAMHFLLLELVVPIWISGHTSAPRWVAAGTYLVNTVACVLFQVRMSRGAEDLRIAARLQRSGGWWLAFGMVTYASAALFADPWLAAGAMLVGAAIHVAGELRQSAASFAIGFNLPPDHLQGQYQALWSLTWGLGMVIGPTWVTWLVFTVGKPGWFVLGAQFDVVGLATPWLVERALRDRRRSVMA